MLSKWPIRNKLLVGLTLLLVIVGTLSWGGIHGLYAYRALVKSLSRRVAELPLANELSLRVSNLRIALSETRNQREIEEAGGIASVYRVQVTRDEFDASLQAVRDTLAGYRVCLGDPADNDTQIGDMQIGDSHRERQAVQQIEKSLDRITSLRNDLDWMLSSKSAGDLDAELIRLQTLTAQLPDFLRENISDFTEEARTQYRTLITLTWGTAATTGVLLALLVNLFYRWVFRPLRVLIKGSRKVANGQFQHRIRLDTQDEMAELAAAMNQMTERFQTIRDDLDHQVQERTKQVVRSEQLASVGFLAAGVAHEINNPLASIAMCAESLEGRVNDVLNDDNPEHAIIRSYLQMIQSEAFRCKGITERLLDFSRMGEVQRQAADLRELVESVIEMIRHLGKYQHKSIQLADGPPVQALMNSQEIKQVVLNLATNALDSLETGGEVTISVSEKEGQAQLTVVDNGCGMTPDVLEHLFEPFFTRRRGGQGTGLGLSIVHRIVEDHEGAIDVQSDGPGHGSRFHVRLPLALSNKESSHRYQAA